MRVQGVETTIYTTEFRAAIESLDAGTRERVENVTQFPVRRAVGGRIR
jgi:hypothetical protein